MSKNYTAMMEQGARLCNPEFRVGLTEKNYIQCKR